MPRTIRFHLDEDTDPAIADELRRYGIDVTTSQDVGLLGAPYSHALKMQIQAFNPRVLRAVKSPAASATELKKMRR
jgi:hypothetical protein